jgi:uncharacterized membrane protein YeaQ/YmgE (transglycosylase-associated protein family)
VVGALILGLLAGYLARILIPGRTPKGLLITLLLGVAGAWVGYLIFTELLGIGDTEAFDLGGLPGAVIGTMLLLYLHRKLVVEPRRWW